MAAINSLFSCGPPQCEACAAGQGVPPPPGVACRARRGIATNRVRRAAPADVRSVQVRRGARRAIYLPGKLEAPPPTLPWRAAAGTQFVLSFTSNRSADKPQCHSKDATSSSGSLSVEVYLLVITSCPDPIINICMLDHSRCDQLARYSWPRRRARRALPGKACRHHPARRAGRGVTSPPNGQGVLPLPP